MKYLLLASCCILPACASIVEGSSQKINISTNPPAQVRCNASNSRGSAATSTPGVLEVKRSKSDLTIRCESDEYAGQLSDSSNIESWAFGNLLLGGIIGGAIDAGTGALFTYNDAITVPLTPKPSAAIASPVLDSMTASPAESQPTSTQPMDSQPVAPDYASPQAQPSAAPSTLPPSTDFLNPPSVR